MFWGPWLALTRSIGAFTPDVFLPLVHRLNRNMAPIKSAMMPISLLSMIPVLVVSYAARAAMFITTLAALILFAVALLVTVFIEAPIVKQIGAWTVPTLPGDWTQLRDRWGVFHVVRVDAAAAGLICLLAGAIFF
jgi:hypothetical protein